MEELNIQHIQTNGGLQTMKISGFSEEELYALKKMPHSEAEDKLLDLLDARNSSIGTRWKCGYGVYGIWFDNEAAYVNIGNSCD